ncbi:hypothetical protein ACWC09_29250 [Streptomyces sp. NPDC001617]
MNPEPCVVGVDFGTLSDRAAAYDRLYAEYRILHDYFGRGANDVLHRPRRIRTETSA